MTSPGFTNFADPCEHRYEVVRLQRSDKCYDDVERIEAVNKQVEVCSGPAKRPGPHQASKRRNVAYHRHVAGS